MNELLKKYKESLVETIKLKNEIKSLKMIQRKQGKELITLTQNNSYNLRTKIMIDDLNKLIIKSNELEEKNEQQCKINEKLKQYIATFSSSGVYEK